MKALVGVASGVPPPSAGTFMTTRLSQAAKNRRAAIPEIPASSVGMAAGADSRRISAESTWPCMIDGICVRRNWIAGRLSNSATTVNTAYATMKTAARSPRSNELR